MATKSRSTLLLLSAVLAVAATGCSRAGASTATLPQHD